VPQPAPITINPDAIYPEAAVVLTLDVPSSVLARARRSGQLQSRRHGRRTYYLGRWLLDWLLGQEVARAG
jgi:hypothetical protein